MSETKIPFGKIFWPSFLAVFIMSIIGLLLFFLIVGGIIGGLGDFGPKPLAIKNNTVLHMTLNGPISENSSSKFDPISLALDTKVGLSDILFGIEHAKQDPKIKGIFVDIGTIMCGYATASEIRKALGEFKKSGKFVYAYNAGEVITQKEYYISSIADKVYGFPTSNMEFLGLGGELSFFKNTLDKLEIEVQIIRGTNNDFKSAVEPFFRTNMSDSSRLQMQRYVNSMWDNIRHDISQDRKISIERLNELADSALVRNAAQAVSHGLIDALLYRDEMMVEMSKKIGLTKNEEPTMEAFEKYAKKNFYQNQSLAKYSNPNIAVILAEGDVSVDGDGLSSKQICKLFQKVRKNKTIKTVVFRVNSPGGSALASEEIWREVVLTNKIKKVIVSMGDVAASGGYYIAAPATYIFADPTTITGSIGVFGMIPYTGKMFENKLGVTFDRVSSNKHAIISPNRKLTPEEFGMVQKEVDEIYDQFLVRVSEGRKLTKEQVNQMARGRVWTGTDALKIGLIDEIGGIQDAINYAAKNAGISKKKILYYPFKKEGKFDGILEQLEDEEDGAEIKLKHTALPKELIETYNQMKKIESMCGMQMRLPFEINWN